jgi:hypothetical protein
MGGYRSVDYGLICGRTSPQRLPVITRLLSRAPYMPMFDQKKKGYAHTYYCSLSP